MTTEVTKAFRQRVETRVWLDEATRERAIRKVVVIQSFPEFQFLVSALIVFT